MPLLQVYKGYCPAKNIAVAIKMVDLEKYEGKTDLVSVALNPKWALLWLVHVACPEMSFVVGAAGPAHTGGVCHEEVQA